MTERAETLLTDIADAVKRIEEFTAEIKNFGEYSADLKSKSDVERQLIIIGEAVNKLIQEEQFILNEAEKIISFRNRLAHAYDSIDDSIVWLIIKRHLPQLKNEITEILK